MNIIRYIIDNYITNRQIEKDFDALVDKFLIDINTNDFYEEFMTDLITIIKYYSKHFYKDNTYVIMYSRTFYNKHIVIDKKDFTKLLYDFTDLMDVLIKLIIEFIEYSKFIHPGLYINKFYHSFPISINIVLKTDILFTLFMNEYYEIDYSNIFFSKNGEVHNIGDNNIEKLNNNIINIGDNNIEKLNNNIINIIEKYKN